MHTEQIRTDRGDVRIFQDWLTGEDLDSSGQLLLTVVFTTVAETLVALRRASILADELGVRIRIFVPYVVPYPLPIDCPQADPAFKIRQFRTLCEHEPIETRIEIKLCRDARECLTQELAPRSVVLIGDESGSRFGASCRLAKSLERCGHHVLLIRRHAQANARASKVQRSRWLGLLEWTCLLAGLVALVLILL